jgi:photosystem II stability/assembly factor-like uncharacterized protein
VAESIDIGNFGSATALFVSTDDGLTFVQHAPEPGSAASEHWRSLAFVNPRSGVLVMGATTSDVSTLLYTSDGGASWSKPSIAGLPQTIYRAFGKPHLDGSDIVVPVTTWTNGSDGPSNAELRLLISLDQGASFSAVGSPEALGANLNTVAATYGATTWVIPVSGLLLLQTQDRGATWSTISPQGLPAGVLEIYLTSSTSGTVLVAQSGCSAFKSDCWTHAQLLATSNAGRIWDPVG